MTNIVTSSSEQDLTGSQTSQESTEESIDTVGTDTDLPDGAKNVQHAIQLARERENEAKRKADELAQEVATLRRQEKQQKMAEMTEAERYKTLAEESEAKAARLEIGILVRDSIAGKDLPKPIADLLIKTPWAIPAVTEEIGDSPSSWEDIISSVKKHLPVYVDSLVVKSEKSLEEEPSSRRIDSERSVDNVVTADHIYTEEEVKEISKDPVLYAKHRDRILKQMAKHSGSLPKVR